MTFGSNVANEAARQIVDGLLVVLVALAAAAFLVGRLSSPGGCPSEAPAAQHTELS